MAEEKTCLNCGKKFIPTCHITRQKYCSNECRYRYNNAKRYYPVLVNICPECGGPLHARGVPISRQTMANWILAAHERWFSEPPETAGGLLCCMITSPAGRSAPCAPGLPALAAVSSKSALNPILGTPLFCAYLQSGQYPYIYVAGVWTGSSCWLWTSALV